MRFSLPFLLAALFGQQCLAQQNKNCFFLGSTKSQVRTLQGIPVSIYKNSPTKETWYYKKSSVVFEGEQVIEYDNYGNNLRLCRNVSKTQVDKEILEKKGYLFPERSKSKATKADTQEWILAKLNENVPRDIYIEGYTSTMGGRKYPGRSIRNTTFTIEGTALVVNYYVDDPQDPHNETYKIPIWDLLRLHAEKGALVLTTRGYSVSHIVGAETVKENSFSIRFNFEDDPGLKERLTSAMAHLVKFYKSPKKKETF